MKIMKFGGACITNTAGIQALREIVLDYPVKDMVIVISAIGKTTNALEKVVDAVNTNDTNIDSILKSIKFFHLNIIQELLPEHNTPLNDTINAIFEKLITVINTNKCKEDGFIYDQIVPFGEMLSTHIVSYYLQQKGYDNLWFDARDVITTNSDFKDANVIWEKTTHNIQQKLSPVLNDKPIITQGFIGKNIHGDTTTLGREGSDFTAAIFGYALDADNVIIWKDVAGIYNADPRNFNDAELIKQLSYHEAIEMTYYGAKVIHPKTIKPLQNKKIELWIKSFKAPQSEGTLIAHQLMSENIPPVIVYKENQVLLSINPKDFSFISEDSLSTIFTVFAKFRVKINMTQHSAISFSCCINQSDRIPSLVTALNKKFKVLQNEKLQLLTIRHYTKEQINKLVENKQVILEQKSRHTVQLVLKRVNNNPTSHKVTGH